MTEGLLSVLVVDGRKEEYRRLLAMLSSAPGEYAVGWARSAVEAHAAIEGGAYDAFLVNETLEDGTGLEVVWEVATSVSEAPVILLAEAYGEEADREARNLGASDYLARGELNARFLDRALRHAVIEKKYRAVDRGRTEDLIYELFELRDTKERLEVQGAENARMAEELALVKADLEGALAQVMRQKEELERLNREKDRLFSIVSHDLRGPFTALMGLTKLMVAAGDGLEKAQLMAQAGRVHEAAERILALIENLLDWSRLQMDRVKVEPAPFELQALARKNVDLFAPIAAQKGVVLASEVPAGLRAFADAATIDTVIRNLVNNAVKFTPEGGCVTISGRDDGPMVAVTVRDTGVGMTPEQLDHLFDLGKENTTRGTRGEKGTGLGLLLCKELVDRNGGALQVESEAGTGSRFTVFLPCPRDPAPRRRP
jgi:signal transduction histidine kinase